MTHYVVRSINSSARSSTGGGEIDSSEPDDGESSRRPRPAARSGEVRVGRAATGKGVFARRRYLPYMVVGEIEGQIIADPNYGSEYCFDMEDGSFLEPSTPFRFVNHSCDPNCDFEVFELADTVGGTMRRQLLLTVLTEIRPGEELTIDYNWPIEGAIRCRCGAANCRGWVIALGELPALLAFEACDA